MPHGPQSSETARTSGIFDGVLTRVLTIAEARGPVVGGLSRASDDSPMFDGVDTDIKPMHFDGATTGALIVPDELVAPGRMADALEPDTTDSDMVEAIYMGRPIGDGVSPAIDHATSLVSDSPWQGARGSDDGPPDIAITLESVTEKRALPPIPDTSEIGGVRRSSVSMRGVAVGLAFVAIAAAIAVVLRWA